MLISQEVTLELSVIKAKVQNGEKPITDIDNLITKIEGMSVENLRVLTDLDNHIKELAEIKKRYRID